ncbi:MAG: sigma-54-dependent Fis family transcriptional regulator [Gemmatimonadetes bacterium]|nr:sigma-54-dependent Fis family transcriptional regulator [Gemmatimonadota bacterium]
MKTEKDLTLVLPDLPPESVASDYWEIGAHPNYLLSVNEDVVGARDRLSQVSDTSLTVILYGERGVGKEVLAHGVHSLSSRAEKSFTALNAYAVPRASIDRELFGNGYGGKLDSGEDGTMYIHGIESLPQEIRERLVEWKRDREKTSEPSARIILSCEAPSMNADGLSDLERMWAPAGGAVRVEIPPLRERPEDIPLLATHIVQKYGPFYGSSIRVLRGSFLRFLQAYQWPGNTRELERVLRRFLVIEDEEVIRAELGSKQPVQDSFDDETETGGSLKAMVARAVSRVESREIARALERARWNKKRAAADLGISYKSLLNKIKQYEIET